MRGDKVVLVTLDMRPEERAAVVEATELQQLCHERGGHRWPGPQASAMPSKQQKTPSHFPLRPGHVAAKMVFWWSSRQRAPGQQTHLHPPTCPEAFGCHGRACHNPRP